MRHAALQGAIAETRCRNSEQPRAGDPGKHFRQAEQSQIRSADERVLVPPEVLPESATAGEIIRSLAVL
ncbi:MAG: hypothetical protein VB858_03050 [Planctomycetaceae bacterium]